MAEIKREGDNLIISVPLYTIRSNPYVGDDMPIIRMDNIIGLVESDWEAGLCYRIDFSYKDKGDQWSDYFYKSDRLEIEKTCKEFGFDIVYDLKDSDENIKLCRG